MWSCHKCGKPVYFAERRQSLGYDWHPTCLKCEECGKVLNPGTHAEHRGVPYCHIPCYAALFGPQLFGHGSTTESHRSFGRRETSFIREQNQLKSKVDDYNQFYQNVSKCQISSREVNGRFVLEGIMKVYWGTEASVRLKEFDDMRLIRSRKALSMGPDMFVNDVKDESEAEDETDSALPYFNPRTHPLFKESLLELNKASTDPFYEKLLDQDLLEDVSNDNLLSYDPIQKWKTLNNLVNDGSRASIPDDVSEPNDNEDNSEPPSVSERLQRSMSVQAKDTNRNNISYETKCSTLPSKFKNLKDDLDDLLQVERTFNDHDRVYHTVNGQLPVENDHNEADNDNANITWSEQNEDEHDNANIITNQNKDTLDNANITEQNEDEIDNANITNNESLTDENHTPKKFTVEKVDDPCCELGPYDGITKSEPKVRSKGPRQLRRRHGKKMDKAKLRRRSSINGHWYDRDTSVFTPPKHTPMCVYTTSKMTTAEVVTTLLDKYKIESEPGHYALYVVKETGETRMVGPSEAPLILRVNLGPHEEISKIYLMDKHNTNEISNEVAQFLNFSYAELRSFLNMFYEEEEREADRIRTKYLVIRRRLEHVLRLRKGQGQVMSLPTEQIIQT